MPGPEHGGDYVLQQQGCLSGYGTVQRYIAKKQDIDSEVHKGNVYGSVVVEQPVSPTLRAKYDNSLLWRTGPRRRS